MATSDRVIPAVVHDDGSVSYSSVTSPASDTSPAVCYMVPMRIIPVIFVPGIMGSNLMNAGTGKAVWLTNSKVAMAWKWSARGPDERKKELDPQTTDVFAGGDLPSGTALSKDELKHRGWGEVSAMSYGDFLVWLENALNDASAETDYGRKGLRAELMHQAVSAARGVTPLTHDEVALSYKYQLPVHAVGYNWLQSNKTSADRLASKIEKFKKRYRDKGYMCSQVILVTHSMGGLVARYCSENLKGAEGVLGIVHGVMPATGAATAYKRVKAGTEDGAGLVLGDNAAKVTAVFAQSPGALQLLPSTDYGMGWLTIRDHDRIVSLPKQDPYTEIYLQRDKWWGLISDQLLNPLDPKKQSVEQDWEGFTDLIKNQVRPFHEAISRKYHRNTYAFYGDDIQCKAWGNVTWKRTVRSDMDGRMPNLAPTITDPLNCGLVWDNGLGEQTVSADTGAPSETAMFALQDADEPGDRTVPRRSGKAPQGQPGVQVCVPFAGVDHGAAYTDAPPPGLTHWTSNPERQRFALWAIIKVAYQVKYTSMAYRQ